MSKTVLVTGSASGLGRATCEHLLRSTEYVVYGIDQAPCPGALDEHARYSHLVCDLRDYAALRRIIEASEVARGSLDAIVNCAGVMPTALVSKIDPNVALEAFSVNCVAPLYLTRLLLKPLIRAKEAVVVYVTSVAAELDIPGEVVYGATKSALRHASEAMSVELARFGIRVNCIAPALVETPMTAHLTQAQCDYMRTKQAYQTAVTPHDVAVTIHYLLEGPPTITSSTLYVGGIAK